LVRGHPTYVIDTDWLVRMPGKQFLKFCKGPVISFGAWLDRQINQVTHAFIASLRNPKIEPQITPMAVGLGVFISVVLFSVLLFFQFWFFL
jgi:hypothetical protein